MAGSKSGSVEAINSSLSAVCLFESCANLYYSPMACWRGGRKCWVKTLVEIVVSFTQKQHFIHLDQRSSGFVKRKTQIPPLIRAIYLTEKHKQYRKQPLDKSSKRGLSVWSMKTSTKHLGQMFFSHTTTFWAANTAAYRPLDNFVFRPLSEGPHRSWVEEKMPCLIITRGQGFDAGTVKFVIR